MDRVQKLLSNYGYCSRRKAEQLIEEGRVQVNGETIKPGDKASPEDEITVDGKKVSSGRRIYLIFNKPVGCVTAVSDQHEKTVMSYIKIKERIFPIGRLDKHTSGLLLLTNDGDFSNKITHPRYEIKKTYVAQVDNQIMEEDLQKIQRGVQLEDGLTAPAKIKLLEKDVAEITIHEGKNRIVRRIFEALGYQVTKLERTKIGSLSLGTLRPGKFRDLSKKEMQKIFS